MYQKLTLIGCIRPIVRCGIQRIKMLFAAASHFLTRFGLNASEWVVYSRFLTLANNDPGLRFRDRNGCFVLAGVRFKLGLGGRSAEKIHPLLVQCA